MAVALAMAALPWTPADAQSTPCFAQVTAITNNVNRASSIVLTDFNGDGKLDFAASNRDAASVLVEVGDGLGNFAPFGADGLTAVGSSPRAIAAGDFDRDGRVDFVTANATFNTASVRLNRGGGTFQAMPDVSVAAAPSSVAVGDVNGDGIFDLVFTASMADRISVRIGNGAGGFTPAPDVLTGVNPRSAVLVDVNGDGMLDLANVNAGSNTVTVFLNVGFANFVDTSPVSVVPGVWVMAFGDFNRDGRPDFAAASGGPDGTGKVSIHLGNGSGGFGRAADVSVASEAEAVAVADINGDGKLDLLVGHAIAADGVSLRLGDGFGGFGTPSPAAYNLGGVVSGIGVGDINGDTALDIVASMVEPGFGRIGTMVNACDLNEAPTVTVPGPQTVAQGGTLSLGAATANSITVADVDIGANAAQVTLTAGQGVLTLGTTAGLSFSTGDGADDGTMTFAGTMPQVNAALSGLQYRPTGGYSGPDQISISVSDRGKSGVGGPKVTNGAVAISVTSSGTPPPPGTPTPPGTPGQPGQPGACPAQGRVSVTTTISGGRLLAHVVTTPLAAQPIPLRELRFGTLQNARVTLNGQDVVSGQTFTVPGGATSADFAVERVTPGQPVTVPLTVVDGCGEWRTFVGGGQTAGF